LAAQHVPRQHVPDADAEYDMDGQQLAALVSFVDALPAPVAQLPKQDAAARRVAKGERLFEQIGCAHCHPRRLGAIEGLYGDLLLHRIIEEGIDGESYRRIEPKVDLPTHHPLADEWKTPPLLGVADSAPYLHDGRAPSFDYAIAGHDGEGATARAAFTALALEEKGALRVYLMSLRRAPRLIVP
jgi:CxxC motif-containing protein (DUF1111 family)